MNFRMLHAGNNQCGVELLCAISTGQSLNLIEPDSLQHWPWQAATSQVPCICLDLSDCAWVTSLVNLVSDACSVIVLLLSEAGEQPPQRGPGSQGQAERCSEAAGLPGSLQQNHSGRT